MEILKSISIKYPEYSVVTPQTLQEFTIRSLTVQDEERLKGSLLTPNQFSKHLNSIIWDCLVKKPDDIKTIDEFLDKITIKDREALLFGLYHVTYKDISNYDVVCSSCSKSHSISINIEKSFTMDAYVDEGKGGLLNQEFPVQLQIANNITSIIKQPTLRKENNLMGNMIFSKKENMDIGIEMLVVDKFLIEEDDGSGRKSEYSMEQNMLRIYNQLPSKDRKLINKTYIDNLGIYGVSIKSQVVCPACGESEVIDIDLVSQFFRALYE